MPNLVVTSTTNAIKVLFNDLSFFDQNLGHTYTKGTWIKENILSVRLNEDHVIIEEMNSMDWKVSHTNTPNTFQIDTVDGVAPSSLDDLYTKLSALIE